MKSFKNNQGPHVDTPSLDESITMPYHDVKKTPKIYSFRDCDGLSHKIPIKIQYNICLLCRISQIFLKVMYQFCQDDF